MFPINASYLGTTSIWCYAFSSDNKTNTPDSLNKLNKDFHDKSYIMSCYDNRLSGFSMCN